MPSNTVDANAGSTGADASVAASAAARNARVGVGTDPFSVTMSERRCEARAGEAWRRAAARGGVATRASVGVAVTANIEKNSGGRFRPAVRCCLFGGLAILSRVDVATVAETRGTRTKVPSRRFSKHVVLRSPTRVPSSSLRPPNPAMGKPGASELASVVDDASSSTEAKLAALSKLFLDKASALHKCERRLEDAEAQRGVALVQRDATRNDMEKVLAVKDKLEVLCRELQKANKAVVADAKASAAAEAAKRSALSDKFESGLGDISEKLNAHALDREASLKENEELREHLRKLIERGDLQEAHLKKAKETFDLEKQLMEAQLAEAAERRVAADALRDALEQQLAARGERENALTEQLAGYSAKFSEFQSVITQSNETFAAFKRESSSREKALAEAERRAAELERKARASDVALIEMLDEKEKLTKTVSMLTAQKEKLEGLCRALRAAGGQTENVPPDADAGAKNQRSIDAAFAA